MSRGGWLTIGLTLMGGAARGWTESGGIAPLAASGSLSPSDHARLALSLAHAKQYDEAVQVLTDLLSLAPQDVDTRLIRGRVYAWAGRFEEAVADLRMVVDKSPRYGDAWSALGDAYAWAGRQEEAVHAYGKWGDLEPGKPAPHMSRGKMLQALRRFSQAREEYGMALTLGQAPEAEARLVQLDQANERSPWSVGVGGSPQFFYGRRSDWLDVNVLVKRQWEGLSLALGYARITRYAVGDDGGWADLYASLWPRAYANVLIQVAPASVVIPRWDGAVEVFQGVGSGWEAALRLRRMTFPSSAVALVTPAVAWYAGEWFLRLRATAVSPAALDLSWSVQARRYVGNVDTYLEATAGMGVDEIASTSVAGSSTLAWSKSASVKIQLPLWPWCDVGVSCSIQDESSLGFSTTLGCDLRFRP